jgi:hypothetical protein
MRAGDHPHRKREHARQRAAIIRTESVSMRNSARRRIPCD